MLVLLRDVLGARVRLVLQPALRSDSDRPPLMSYYRFVAPSPIGIHGKESFASSLSRTSAARAVFTGLDSRIVLTLKVLPPEPWNVQARRSELDTDNLMLPPGRIQRAEWELKSLLVAGQCHDLTHERPPNGLQLQLVDLAAHATQGSKPRGMPSSETLVMQNFGYFQLQASPGIHAITLAPGRASELYEVRV